MGKVIVFGSLNMDLSIEADRAPRQGETLAGRDFLTNPGGKGANQAVAAARAGVRTLMVGAVGDDLFGERLVANLEGYGVDCSLVQRREEASTGVAMILRTDGDNRIVLSHGANVAIRADEVPALLAGVAQPGDVLLAQMECDLDATLAALRWAHGHGLYTMLNVAPPQELPATAWQDVDLVCVNETECEALTGALPQGDAEVAAALDALSALGDGTRRITAVVTLGEHGSAARLADDDGLVLRVPAQRVPVVDTTAAGDTYLGYLAAAHVRGLTLEQGMLRASRAAAVTTTRRGAQQAIPALDELGE